MKRLLLALLLLCLVLPAAHAAGNAYYVNGLTADRVHLRAQPVAEGKSLGLYYTGVEATRLKDVGNGWVQVKIGAETGYMQAAYLTQTVPLAQSPLCAVHNKNSSWVNLRSGPSTSHSVVAKLDNGTALWVLGETSGGWSYVETLSQRGYMMSSFVEETETAPVTPSTCIVGKTAEGDYIHQLTADNGQTLYFTAVEEAPFVKQEDVNFDGVKDVVVCVSQGASNGFFEFFVNVDGRYVHAEHAGLGYGLANYQLYPAQKMVLSQASNGNAGALHEWYLFRWNGAELQLVRSAISINRETSTYMNGVSTLMTYDGQYEITITEHNTSDWSSRVLWKKSATAAEIAGGNVLAEEESRLWLGLK